MRKRLLVLVLMGLLVAGIIGGVHSATKTSTQPPPENPLPAPMTTQQSSTFPSAREIVINPPDYGEWGDHYHNGTIPELVAKTHPTITGYTAVTAPDPYCDEDAYRERFEIVHAWGMKYFAGIRPVAIENTNWIDPQQLPSLLEATCVNIYGDTIRWQYPASNWQCTNNPAWREFLLETAKRSIALGADGIAIDEWGGTFWSLRQALPDAGCFCQYCMEGFREYLKAKYSAEELSEFGIDDINSFDYGDFIRERYLTIYEGIRWGVPLFGDFEVYQLKTVKQFWREFIPEVKVFGRTHGKDVYFSAGTSQMSPLTTPIAYDSDFLGSEWKYDYPPNSRSIPLYQIAISLGAPIFSRLQCCIPHSVELVSRPDVTTLWKIYTAEAYSARGFLNLPYGYHSGTDPEQTFDGSLDDLSPYYDFIHTNERYYEDRVSTARMAVLYSYPSIKLWADPTGNFYGICNLLLDTHFQYDVLFSGDDNWMEDKLTLSALQSYEVVVLPGTRHLTDRQVDLLLSYVRLGGRIIAFGEIGSHNEKGYDPAERPELESLLKEGSHNYGLGKFVYMSGQVGSNYLNTRDASARQQFSDALRGLIYPNIQTTANENMVILEYWNSKTQSIVLHLINYSYDIDKQQLHPQKDIELEVLLYEELAGKNLAISYSSPDWKGLERLKYESNGAKVKFTIPKLDFYGVVNIGQKGSVIPAIKLLLLDD